eukprot:3876473-Rhodomonas_salina.2
MALPSEVYPDSSASTEMVYAATRARSTDVGYDRTSECVVTSGMVAPGDSERRQAGPFLPYHPRVLSYPSATRCTSSTIPIVLHVWYAMCSTDIGYAAAMLSYLGPCDIGGCTEPGHGTQCSYALPGTGPSGPMPYPIAPYPRDLETYELVVPCPVLGWPLGTECGVQAEGMGVPGIAGPLWHERYDGCRQRLPPWVLPRYPPTPSLCHIRYCATRSLCDVRYCAAHSRCHVRYRARPSLCRYAMSGTEIGYDPTRSVVFVAVNDENKGSYRPLPTLLCLPPYYAYRPTPIALCLPSHDYRPTHFLRSVRY